MSDSLDFTFGCRSGIQKAVRRGDLNLARTCFEALWTSKEDRNWLKWRVPIIIAEEAWHFISEYAQFIQSRPGDDIDSWRRFLYRLTLLPKNKDASALKTVVNWEPKLLEKLKHGIPDSLRFEFNQQVACLQQSGEPADIIDDLVAQLAQQRTLSDYEAEGVNRIVNRAFSGGMLCDRWFILACVILTYSRGLEPDRIAHLEKKALKDHKAKAGPRRKPKLINLPWYVFDMHTQMGKIAASIFMKRQAESLGIESREDLEHLWFCLESAFIPERMHDPRKISSEATVDFMGEFWWPINVKLLKRLPSANSNPWANRWPDIQEHIKGIVEWLADKRSLQLS